MAKIKAQRIKAPQAPATPPPTGPPEFEGASGRDLAYAMLAQKMPQPNVTPEPHPPVRSRVPTKRKVSVAVRKPSTKIKKV